jgi:hypothetical protein
MKNTSCALPLLTLLLLLSAVPARAQWESGSTAWGFQIGMQSPANNFFSKKPEELTVSMVPLKGPRQRYSAIGALPEMIIPSRFSDSTYSVQEKRNVGFNGSLFVYHRLENLPWLAIEGNLVGSQVKSGFQYADTAGLTYDMDFQYWYGGLQLATKIYPGASKDEQNDDELWRGFFVRLGLQAGLNLTPSSITYCHDPVAIYGPCAAVEEELRRVLKGKGDFGFTGGIGYDIRFSDTGYGLNLEARYYHGTADVINTLNNGYEFSDPVNQVRTVQFSASFAIPF